MVWGGPLKPGISKSADTGAETVFRDLRFEPHAVGTIRLKRTGLRTIQPKLTGESKGKVDIFNLSASRKLPSLATPRPAILTLQSKWPALIGWRMPFIVWSIECCIWNGHVETDALNPFNRPCWLTHVPSEIRFGRSSSTTRPKQFVYQSL